VLPRDELLNETLGPSRNNEILIDNNSYRHFRRPYLTENCTDIDSRDSRHRGCRIVVILHDDLE
jgi:hypothetical protein